MLVTCKDAAQECTHQKQTHGVRVMGVCKPHSCCTARRTFLPLKRMWHSSEDALTEQQSSVRCLHVGRWDQLLGWLPAYLSGSVMMVCGPCIEMMLVEFLCFSRPLNGRTRTATLTLSDMVTVSALKAEGRSEQLQSLVS